MKKAILYIVLLLFSCTRSEENMNLQTNSPYKGNWVGSFKGHYSGKLSLVIDKTGNIEGELLYSDSSEMEKISGYVFANGRIDLYTKSNFVIHGILNYNNSNGEWSKENYKGSYNLNKY